MKEYINATSIKFLCVALLFCLVLFKFTMNSPIELVFNFLLCYASIELCLFSSKILKVQKDTKDAG